MVLRRITLLAAVLVALALPESGRADIALRDLSESAARPGQLVSVVARGYPGPKPWGPLPVVMMPAEPLPDLRVRRSELRAPRYRIVGTIRRWHPQRRNPDHANGPLRFRVPRVAPGRYVFALFCETCVRGRGGSLITTKRMVLRVRSSEG